MGSYEHDLSRWIPHLLAVWRAQHRAPEGPRDRLLPNELREIASGVQRLSQGLTRERALAGQRYMDDPRLLGAYLLFYWPVSYAQAREALGEVPRPKHVLDLGSGPGPLAFAALDAGAKEATCADRSRAALDLASKLAAEAGEALATRAWDPLKTSSLPEGAFDLVTLGHVLNELPGEGPAKIQRRAALLELALSKVAKGGTVLVLEPALKETSRALLEVRDVLVKKGYAVRAPCLYRDGCPALHRPNDWCHAERRWKAPPLIEAIAQRAGLHKEALKMSYLALAPLGEAWAEPPPGDVFRIVSEPLESKGRARYMGCGPSGRVGLAMQEKHRTEATEPFFHLQRGTVVRVTGTEPRGDGLALGEGATVEVLARPGQPLERK